MKFKIIEAAKILGMTRENLQSLIERGFVEPTYPSEGQGRAAFFSKTDIYEIAIFKHLTSKGLRRKWVSLLLGNLSIGEFSGNWLVVRSSEDKAAPDVMFTSGDRVHIGVKSGTVHCPNAPTEYSDELSEEYLWEDILIVNIPKILTSIDGAIESFLEER